jgi:hypothetical protein
MAQEITLSELETLHRAKWTQEARDAYLKEHPDNFAGPEGSYPIKDGSDVDDAWRLAGHAANPDAVRSKIKSIAKRLGLSESLPDTAKEDSSDAVRTVEPETSPAQGEESAQAQSDDTQEEERAQVPELPTTATLYAPITRIDNEKREVEGVATSEAIDSFGTIFSYDASKKAFQTWIERTANVREMHDRKAVGKGVGVYFDDTNKQVIVRSRVSRGAQDTWIKIQEGVLSGYSVGAVHPTWGKVERDGKTYPYLMGYDLAELSYVDNASNPDGQGLAICRVNELTDVVDITEVEPEQTSSSTGSLSLPGLTSVGAVVSSSSADLERAGARISSDTRTGLHEARDYQMKGAMKTMAACDCPDCQSMLLAIDPDKDGDIDLTSGTADTDHDAEALAERVMQLVEARFQEMQSRFVLPIQRMQAIAGTFAQSHAQDIDLSPIQRSIDTIVERLDTVATQQSSLDEVRSALAEVKGQVEKIANQPVSGGPVLNAAATDPRFERAAPSPLSDEEVEQRVLERLRSEGKLNTHELQTAAAARSIRRW